MVVVAATVERLRILQQGQAEFDQTRIIGQIRDFLAQPFFEMGALAFEAAELFLDLGLRHAAVGGHVQQVVLFRIEGLDLGLELLFEQAGSPLVVRQSGGHMGSGLLYELPAKSHCPVDPLDGVLDLDHVDVAAGAVVGPHVRAEEVLVLVAA
ncbi:hypothetical protein E1263_05295 [Kribbella antibiotica]|uniref:Uncharacterized protein n=1 Tax=Kribbella antibiotica TaxID=190195 RepID=A0A4R4ZSH3_9ACTN|nr:hypothetical protein [Kribbella antibiotica]TDD62028.1 hypothetical protein E1263_05295 [Kribbella antibiotica]